MWTGRRFRLSMIAATCLVAVTGAFILSGGGEPSGLSGFPLARPAFAQSTAFPEEEAGFTAYLNVGRLEFEHVDKSLTSLSAVDRLQGTDGKSWFWAEISLSDKVMSRRYEHMSLSWKSNVYVDVNGWIVAWFPRESRGFSELLRWGTGFDSYNPITVETLNNLESTLETVMEAIVVDFKSRRDQIRYYDFRHPTAQELVMFAVYRNTSASFVLPEDLALVAGQLISVGKLHSWTINLEGIPIVSGGDPRGGWCESDCLVSASLTQSLDGNMVRTFRQHVTQPAGLSAGRIFRVTVNDAFEIVDKDGDGRVSRSDVSIDSELAKVVGVSRDAREIIFEVLVESATSRVFNAEYRGSTAFLIHPGISYEVTHGQGGESSAAVFLLIALR